MVPTDRSRRDESERTDEEDVEETPDPSRDLAEGETPSEEERRAVEDDGGSEGSSDGPTGECEPPTDGANATTPEEAVHDREQLSDADEADEDEGE